MSLPGQGVALKAVVKFVINTLVKMAQRREWGEIRIVVQDGQIVNIHDDRSYKRLPDIGAIEPEAARVLSMVG